MNLYFVFAIKESIVQETFLVRAIDHEFAVDNVRRLNRREINEGDVPLYPEGCLLTVEPVEFDSALNYIIKL